MKASQWASLFAVQTVFASAGYASMSPVPAAPEELVSNWAQSWERQDFARYSSFYSDSFYGAGFKSKKQWLDYRRPRVLNPASVVVRIDDVKLLESEPERLVVEFIQYYKSERIQMYSLKKQVWRWEQAVWKIQAETSHDIGPERPLITAEVIRPLSVGEAPPPAAALPSPPAPVKPPPGFSFRLESPDRSPIPRAIDALKFVPVKIRVEGATAFPLEELERITNQQEGKQSTVEDLRQLAESIEAKYKEAGFFLTRVFVPPQHVRDGQFLIRVIEGFVSEIEVEGANDEVRERVRQKLQPLTLLRPAKLDAIERALLLLNDSPHIAVSSLLRPGRKLGASTLVAQVEEQNRMPGSVSISNQIGKDSGEQIVRLSQQFLGVGIPGDSIDLQVGSSDRPGRLANVSARYLMPLNRDGLTGAVGVVSSRSKPAGEAEALNVLSVSEALTARVRAPLHRSREFSLYGEVGLSAIKSQTDLAGIKGYYSDRYDSADLSLQLVDWVTRFGSTSAALGYSQSVEDQSDSPTSDDYDRRQRKATLNFRHSLGLTESVSFSLLGQGQYANRPLLSGEKVSFGGSGVGRGFEPGFMAGERGYGLSAELSYAAPVSLGESVQGRAQVFAFADSAKVESVARTGQVAASEKLYSLGLGLRFQVSNGLRAEILWAKPIRHDRPRQSISEGLFFTLSYSW